MHMHAMRQVCYSDRRALRGRDGLRPNDVVYYQVVAHAIDRSPMTPTDLLSLRAEAKRASYRLALRQPQPGDALLRAYLR